MDLFHTQRKIARCLYDALSAYAQNSRDDVFGVLSLIVVFYHYQDFPYPSYPSYPSLSWPSLARIAITVATLGYHVLRIYQDLPY